MQECTGNSSTATLLHEKKSPLYTHTKKKVTRHCLLPFKHEKEKYKCISSTVDDSLT